ncbi:MAG: AraC family transcriptional regulator [Methyloversatilis sp.]|nr:AraC family transcriptional regulator [Methyloversatilis sp.]
MTDRLEALLAHFSVSARVFNTGALCGLTELDAGDSGRMHLIRAGEADVHHAGGIERVTRPSLLLFPRPVAYRFVTDPTHGADFACARMHFSGGAANPIAAALPDFTCLALDDILGAGPVLDLLFDEASHQYCGRQAVLDRLFEVLLVQVLRHLMEAGRTGAGMLAGLSHPRLRLALVAMHENPAQDWSLEALAERAGMSRSVFANAFRDTVGCTPGAYLQRWRIGLAEQALRRGRTLALIADEVGYGGEAALSRAFKAQTGLSPREWRAAHKR